MFNLLEMFDLRFIKNKQQIKWRFFVAKG